MFPHCTISSAMSVATSRSISAGVMDVVPPLMWPTTSGAVSSTTSALIGLLPAIEGPPVWMVTVMPWARAQQTIGAAALSVFTEPRPISPTRRTPAAAISAKSPSVMPSSRMGAPAWTFTPPGRKFAYDFAATIASALRPTMSLGRPGRCTSPAEIAVVTPPFMPESMKSIVRWRGVKSPKTGWTCESMSPGVTVVQRAVRVEAEHRARVVELRLLAGELLHGQALALRGRRDVDHGVGDERRPDFVAPADHRRRQPRPARGLDEQAVGDPVVVMQIREERQKDRRRRAPRQRVCQRRHRVRRHGEHAVGPIEKYEVADAVTCRRV